MLASKKQGLTGGTLKKQRKRSDLSKTMADMIQIGGATCKITRCCGGSGAQACRVLLSVGWPSTLDEWLLAAEYIMSKAIPNPYYHIPIHTTTHTYHNHTTQYQTQGIVSFATRCPYLCPAHPQTPRSRVVRRCDVSSHLPIIIDARTVPAKTHGHPAVSGWSCGRA